MGARVRAALQVGVIGLSVSFAGASLAGALVPSTHPHRAHTAHTGAAGDAGVRTVEFSRSAPCETCGRPRLLPDCPQEDSPGPCEWDAYRRGNGQGQSFWIDGRQVVHYLKDGE
jgi:hypothetical protein